jgi:hypothetical protein
MEAQLGQHLFQGRQGNDGYVIAHKQQMGIRWPNLMHPIHTIEQQTGTMGLGGVRV